MGKVGVVLKQVLDKHEIRLAKELGVERTTVCRWVNEVRDPASDSIVDIFEAVKELNSDAAKEFATLYLGKIVDN